MRRFALSTSGKRTDIIEALASGMGWEVFRGTRASSVEGVAAANPALRLTAAAGRHFAVHSSPGRHGR